MLIVTVEVVFEGGFMEAEGVRDAFQAMEHATRSEPGCLRYVSSIDVHDSRVLRIYEEWESMEALVPHFKTSHMAEFQTALGGLQSVSMDAKVFEIRKELPFPN
jgi:quinol monooxygenase YgiN